jgi:threonine/homoserine/homoserine lactone efflux protein
MHWDLYLGFVAATVLLVLLPGPNVALIVANSMAHGPRRGLVTVAGTSSAMVLQLALTVSGLTAFLALMAEWFEWLRWLGVAYLVLLGLRAWRAESGAAPASASRRSVRSVYLGGFLVSLSNPKTLFFYGAFLPQFVVPESDPTRQLALLAATFLAIAVLLDGAWALIAGKLRVAFASRGRLWNRLTGGILVGAGIGLALARRS